MFGVHAAHIFKQTMRSHIFTHVIFAKTARMPKIRVGFYSRPNWMDFMIAFVHCTQSTRICGVKCRMYRMLNGLFRGAHIGVRDHHPQRYLAVYVCVSCTFSTINFNSALSHALSAIFTRIYFVSIEISLTLALFSTGYKSRLLSFTRSRHLFWTLSPLSHLE